MKAPFLLLFPNPYNFHPYFILDHQPRPSLLFSTTMRTNLSQRSLTMDSVSSEASEQEEIITLVLDSKKFTTVRKTLMNGSDFFHNLLINRDSFDSVYNIDADPALFPSILAFLRRGIYPIYFDRSSGHDLLRYHALLQEAKYFRIPLLEKWLMEKKYLKAVSIHYSSEWTEKPMAITSSCGSEYSINPTVLEKKTYICPRGIDTHRGKPEACGRQCKNAGAAIANVNTGVIGGGLFFREEQVLKMLLVKKEIAFDDKLLVANIYGEGN